MMRISMGKKFRIFDLSDRYSRFIAFKNTEIQEFIPQKLLWAAVIVILLIPHAPKDKVGGAIFKIVQFLSTRLWDLEKPKKLADFVLYNFAIPLKGFCFLLAFLILAYLIGRCIYRAKSFWNELGIKRIAILSLVIFLVLSLFVFPYSYPGGLNPHRLGTSGLGNDYGHMSLNPFAENTGWHYRRILKPAIAHFIQMDGVFLYYLFSLLCTYILIFMTLTFIESKIWIDCHKDRKTKRILNPKLRFLVYVSVATSSYIMTDFLWPGYVEQLTFILILLMACIPMNHQARLAAVALCMANHEASGFALIPIIFFCFPRREINQALFVIILYFGIWLASYGLNFYNLLSAHSVVNNKESITQLLINSPGLAIAGTFFSYKLFWIIFLYVVWMLWHQKDRLTAVAILSIVLIPTFLIFVAADTTRVAGFGILGMLIILCILIDEYSQSPKPSHRLAFTSIYANIIIPSYPVIFDYPPSLLTYPYRGLYQLIHSVFHSF
jgi:hypothetical protein